MNNQYNIVAVENSDLYVSTVSAAKVVSTIPSKYRLMKKKSGELVLQAAYMWQQGWDKSGFDWEDLETVTEE